MAIKATKLGKMMRNNGHYAIQGNSQLKAHMQHSISHHFQVIAD